MGVWQSPRAKIVQGHAGGASCAENVFPVSGRGDVGRFGDKTKNARCVVRVMPRAAQTT